MAQSGSNCSRVPSSWNFGGNHRKEPERPSALGADQGSDSECQVSSGCSRLRECPPFDVGRFVRTAPMHGGSAVHRAMDLMSTLRASLEPRSRLKHGGRDATRRHVGSSRGCR